MESDRADKKLGEKIELLKAFLESMDVKKLRSESEKYLEDGNRVKLVISWRKGNPSYELFVIKATD